eukprot:3670362-Alexandrium_andersonii.AAC.1
MEHRSSNVGGAVSVASAAAANALRTDDAFIVHHQLAQDPVLWRKVAAGLRDTPIGSLPYSGPDDQWFYSEASNA